MAILATWNNLISCFERCMHGLLLMIALWKWETSIFSMLNCYCIIVRIKRLVVYTIYIYHNVPVKYENISVLFYYASMYKTWREPLMMYWKPSKSLGDVVMEFWKRWWRFFLGLKNYVELAILYLHLYISNVLMTLGCCDCYSVNKYCITLLD